MRLYEKYIWLVITVAGALLTIVFTVLSVVTFLYNPFAPRFLMLPILAIITAYNTYGAFVNYRQPVSK